MESKENILNRWFLYKDPKDLSLLEALGKISEGKLLAKILQNVPKEQLLLICRTSKYIKSICDKYELIDRLYAGDLYIMGNNEKLPKKFSTNVVQVSCASEYFAFVTENGDLYTLGRGANGVLGDGVFIDHKVEIPFKVNIPKVKQVSCGGFHTAFVTQNKNLYTTGNGSDGVLGDGNVESHVVVVPYKVENIPKAKYVFCDYENTSFITDTNDLYTLKDSCIFIHENVKNISRNLTFVTYEGILFKFKPKKKNVVKIQSDVIFFSTFNFTKNFFYITKNGDLYDYSGVYYASNVKELDVSFDRCAFVTQNYELYTFGRGGFGNMGDGILKAHEIVVPFKIKNIPKVSKVSCSWKFTAFITKSEFKFDINCQICGSVAKYHTDKHLFCGRECFNEFYF